jgi:broad specificity phosphatase PhoE
MGKSTTDIDRRRRRRRRRIQIIVIYMAIALGLAWFFESQATTTVVFVRHAEKALTPADDPGLSEAGERRAAELARQLAGVDVVAGIDAVYATSYRRSAETAKPIADALELQVRSYDAADTEQFLTELVKAEKGKIVLVVGHSNTVPVMIGNMGASKQVPPIADDEYDNIYIVSIPWFGKTKTLRLRYGEPYAP